jgi:hypothetical protein
MNLILGLLSHTDQCEISTMTTTPEQGKAILAERAGAAMVRLAVRPAWLGVLDFQTRFPGADPSNGGSSQ